MHQEISRIGLHIVESATFSIENRTYDNIYRGFYSNKTGYVLSQKTGGPPFAGSRKGPNNKYFYDCSKMGSHTVDRDYKIHGYPPNFKGG